MYTNLLLNIDSYKASHYLQFPSDTQGLFSYIEARESTIDAIKAINFFGLQIFLKDYLTKPISQSDINEAEVILRAHGLPFNRPDWDYLLQRYQGYLPVLIKAVPEGSWVPLRQVLVTIESIDQRLFWLPNYLETALVRACWYGSSVATISGYAKALFADYLSKTCDNPAAELSNRLHDFGGRGVSSYESAAIGGAAHLIHFASTATVPGLVAARSYYGPDDMMPGFAIPAAEHASITSWGEPQEVDAYRQLLRQFAKQGATVAVVSDSYNIYRAVDELWGQVLRQEVIDSQARVVIRLDSGNPLQVIPYCLNSLANSYGFKLNSKGFKVLNHVRLLQSDKVDLSTLPQMLACVVAEGFSVENISFGMGGALLQKINRDTFGFAMKCSAVLRQNQWQAIYKRPVDAEFKHSKKGRLGLYRHTGSHAYQTFNIDTGIPAGWQQQLVDVYRQGQLLQDYNLAEIRHRSEQSYAQVNT